MSLMTNKQCYLKLINFFFFSLFQFMTIPIILGETTNIFVLDRLGIGKSTAIVIAAAELVDVSHSTTQVLCFVYNKLGAVQMKKRMDLLNKYTRVRSNAVYTGQPFTSENATCHILIGTPLELAKVVLNDQIPVNHVRAVFFDDADVTMQFDATKSAILKLSGFANFIAFSSSIVHKVDRIIPDVVVLTFCHRNEVMSGNITHFVAECTSLYSKIGMIEELIQRTDDNVMIFASVHIFVSI